MDEKRIKQAEDNFRIYLKKMINQNAFIPKAIAINIQIPGVTLLKGYAGFSILSLNLLEAYFYG